MLLLQETRFPHVRGLDRVRGSGELFFFARDRLFLMLLPVEDGSLAGYLSRSVSYGLSSRTWDASATQSKGQLPLPLRDAHH
jgi:hypothetical protein